MARRTWYRLDNIGKFYSSQAGRSSQTVFRYSAELADGIDPDILQHALDHAIAQFPSFNVHLLNGMFWHYLEQSDGRPLVEPEHLPICSRLHYGPKSMLFRVSYFRNRVNLEASPAAFPAQQIYLRPRRWAVEIITFVTGAILLLHGFFSYLFSWPIPIASASAAALIISVLFINSAILHVPRPLRLMFRYFYIMLAIALVWFVATMNHVVTMFVIPITCLVSLVFDVVLLIVLRAKAIDEYAKYLAFDIVAGLMPLTFIPLGWAPWDVLVMVSGLVSLLVLLGLRVFARRQLFSEFGKQFSA